MGESALSRASRDGEGMLVHCWRRQPPRLSLQSYLARTLRLSWISRRRMSEGDDQTPDHSGAPHDLAGLGKVLSQATKREVLV